MRFRYVVLLILGAVLAFGGGASVPSAWAQGGGAQSGGTAMQRLEVMRSRLDTMRRTLNGAIAGLNAKDSGDKDASPDDPRTRLRGLEKEVSTLLSEVTNLRGKQERAEKYDSSELDKLEAAVADLSTRVDAGMLATASARTATTADTSKAATKKKDKRGLFSRLLGRGGSDEKYAELIGTVAPGRDRQLFEMATHEARKDNFEVARSLYSVIINTYPESAYLPLAKLAIADTFYLEGTTSALIQAAQYYQDWFTFFPTHPLSDDVMLKMAEVEMRKMGLPDREVTSARKAEQRLKVLLQQFPDTVLKGEVETRLREVQENLAMHDKMVGDQYLARFFRGAASNPKGAQSRYLDIVKRYPNFSYLDDVLYNLGVTYVQEEEPDEATKYFTRLVRFYPNSKYAEKAREQLQAIGVAVPDPDPVALQQPAPERPSTMQKFKQELLGSTPKTINKSGILISDEDDANDLIQQAIANGGQLPTTVPTAPVQRRPPARQVAPPPATNTGAAPAGKGSALSVQPTQPGAPRTASDPTKPESSLPPAPATSTPATTSPQTKP
ncbi:MAG TPA: outer membrane protein assembly factor BamD [Pyrinomonadaceae bacterium]|jgi:outer membrane protein assembly factor BamD